MHFNIQHFLLRWKLGMKKKISAEKVIYTLENIGIKNVEKIYVSELSRV